VQEVSNVDFYQAQVAQDRQWIGDMWGTNSSKEVKIAEIQTNAGLGIMDQDAKKEDVKTVTIPMQENLQDAVALVDKWEAAALQVRGDGDVSDTVGQHAMQDKTALSDEKWLGTEEEERFAYVFIIIVI
jgi:phospholipase D1/2